MSKSVHYTDFLSQWKSGDVLTESTRAEGHTDTQGLHQRRKERQKVGNLYSIRAWIDSQCNKPAVWKNHTIINQNDEVTETPKNPTETMVHVCMKMHSLSYSPG